MSSHHIVREKQEPALLVLGLGNFSYEHLGQLLEWSPTVIATMQTAPVLINNQIKIDRIIADRFNDEAQSDIKTIPLTTGNTVKDAFNYLIGEGYPAVNVIIDNINMDDFSAYTAKIDLVIYIGNEKIYPVRSGFRKWKPAGEPVKILGEPFNLEVTGLKHEDHTVYETTADGFFSVTFGNDMVFVSELI